ncbi:hypothetical protein C8R45DRAFT_988092 [Mycena sanguinolenta]|nr:hypothetical protein C8R45DRAFT_988092 [Mycena sanguinolenta]
MMWTPKGTIWIRLSLRFVSRVDLALSPSTQALSASTRRNLACSQLRRSAFCCLLVVGANIQARYVSCACSSFPVCQLLTSFSWSWFASLTRRQLRALFIRFSSSSPTLCTRTRPRYIFNVLAPWMWVRGGKELGSKAGRVGCR